VVWLTDAAHCRFREELENSAHFVWTAALLTAIIGVGCVEFPRKVRTAFVTVERWSRRAAQSLDMMEIQKGLIVAKSTFQRTLVLSFFAGFATIGCLQPHYAEAGIVQFTGAGKSPESPGNAVSAGASISIITGSNFNTLQIVLTNTTHNVVNNVAHGTTQQGDALTVFTFDVSKNPLPALSFQGLALTSGSRIYTSLTKSNTTDSLSGSWTKQLSSPSTTPVTTPPTAANQNTQFNFGVATTGYSGLFNGGSISLGNASPDYGIIAGTGLNGTGPIDSISGSKFPFVLNSITFQWTFDKNSTFSVADISGAWFGFGTDGGSLIAGTPTEINNVSPIPEPASIIVWGLFGMVGAGYARCRKAA
jgi:hypothetical protein